MQDKTIERFEKVFDTKNTWEESCKAQVEMLKSSGILEAPDEEFKDEKVNLQKAITSLENDSDKLYDTFLANVVSSLNVTDEELHDYMDFFDVQYKVVSALDSAGTGIFQNLIIPQKLDS